MITVILLVLVGLVAAFLMLSGVLSAVKGTPVRDVEAPGQDHVPGVNEPGFREGMEYLTRTTICGGHEMELFCNGDETYPRLWADLAAAQRVITLQLYYCEKGRMADQFREVLVERALAGVRVHLLYDAFGSSFPKEYLQALRDAGVHTAPFRPLSILTAHKTQHRAHIRVVCVDGVVGYTGGFGISDKWFGNGRDPGQWRDTNVRFTGPAVHQLQAAFTACWAEATGKLFAGTLLYPLDQPAAADTGAVAGLLHGSPSIGSTEAERFFALSLASARRCLYITNSYFVPDQEIRNLIAAAARRGVDTRVLTTGEATDIKSTLYAGRARYEELLRAGVRVYEYRRTMLHAKTLVVDGHWSAVGSMNADNRSLSLNEETVLMMFDEKISAQLERHFLEDIEHANEITLDEFTRRGAWERVKEHACHLVWRVL